MKILRIAFWYIASLLALIEAGILFPVGGSERGLSIVLLIAFAVSVYMLLITVNERRDN